MTVCDDCKWNMSEEVTDGLFEDFCNEQSTNYLTEDDCEECRPEWCPIVPVPEHGDLIDRDALTAAICSRLCIKDLTYLSPAEKAIVDEINDAPVVIPASADDVNDFTVSEEETLQLTNLGKMCEVFGEKDTNEMFAPAGWWYKRYRKPSKHGIIARRKKPAFGLEARDYELSRLQMA